MPLGAYRVANGFPQGLLGCVIELLDCLRLSAVGIALGDDVPTTGPQPGAVDTGQAQSHHTSANSGSFLGGDAPPGFSLQASNEAPPAKLAPRAAGDDLTAFYQYHNIVQNSDGTIDVPGLGTRKALPRIPYAALWDKWKAERSSPTRAPAWAPPTSPTSVMHAWPQ